MNTRFWKVDLNKKDEDNAVREAARLLQEGGTVAFPTETVYGLGADAGSSEAVANIFAAKGRPSDNPLIVHIADRAQLDRLVEPYPDAAGRLMDRFWPGPLTIVLPAKPGAVSPLVTAGLPTVGVRMPAHPLALRLIAEAGCAVAAPSANRSGRPSPTHARHVREDLAGRIGGILDGGPAGIGLESTVVELVDGGGVRILRPGGITRAQLQEVVEHVVLDESLQADDPAHSAATFTAEAKVASPSAEMVTMPEISPETLPSPSTAFVPRSPGMKYTHYAPQGDLHVVQGNSRETIVEWIQSQIKLASARGDKTGVLTYAEYVDNFQADVVISLGSVHNLAEAANGLYAALRKFDELQVRFILAEACEEQGIGFAVMNRLRRAAGHHVVTV